MNVDRTDNCDDEDNRRLFEALSPNNASDKATQTEIIDGGSSQATARSSTQSEANEHWNAPNNPDTNSWRVFQPDETNYAIWHASGSNDETEEWAAALPSRDETNDAVGDCHRKPLPHMYVCVEFSWHTS